eukprot:Anaeramoba_ignava/a93177_204.p1 GENE.a93177_204~~a93177_204.p1  ORF type:complete len:164 (+),score=51.33 a93177_204:58-492(+)
METQTETTTPELFEKNMAVIVLRGRFAGRKAIVCQQANRGNDKYSFDRCLVYGIERYPKRIIRRHTLKQKERKSRIKPFVKVVNQKHLLPTRYKIDLELPNDLVTGEKYDDPAKRKQLKTQLRTVLKKQFLTGKNRWFFSKLRF